MRQGDVSKCLLVLQGNLHILNALPPKSMATLPRRQQEADTRTTLAQGFRRVLSGKSEAKIAAQTAPPLQPATSPTEAAPPAVSKTP